MIRAQAEVLQHLELWQLRLSQPDPESRIQGSRQRRLGGGGGVGWGGGRLLFCVEGRAARACVSAALAERAQCVNTTSTLSRTKSSSIISLTEAAPHTHTHTYTHSHTHTWADPLCSVRLSSQQPRPHQADLLLTLKQQPDLPGSTAN